MERWLPVPSFPGCEASSEGRIRIGGCVVTQHPRCGYLRVLTPYRKWLSAHRLIAEAFHGPRPDGTDVMHVDGTRSNNRPENLKYGTRSQNCQQIVFDGRRKLSVEEVRRIRTGRESGVALARRYGVSQMTVSDVRRRVTYRHVA